MQPSVGCCRGHLGRPQFRASDAGASIRSGAVAYAAPTASAIGPVATATAEHVVG
jgi:hypothetical protein